MTFSRLAKCGSCRAPIVWALTANGRRMPVDAVPVDDGDFVAGPDGTIVKLAPFTDVGPEVERYTSHFVTCPDRDDWRAPRSRIND